MKMPLSKKSLDTVPWMRYKIKNQAAYVYVLPKFGPFRSCQLCKQICKCEKHSFIHVCKLVYILYCNFFVLVSSFLSGNINRYGRFSSKKKLQIFLYRRFLLSLHRYTEHTICTVLCVKSERTFFYSLLCREGFLWLPCNN